MQALLQSSRDVLGPFLDAEKGALVTDQKIFRDFAAHWEKDYFQDMDALNVNFKFFNPRSNDPMYSRV